MALAICTTSVHSNISCSHREVRVSCGDMVAGTKHIFKDSEDRIQHSHIPTTSKIPSPHNKFGSNEGAAVSSNVHPQSNGESESEYKNIIQDSCGDVVTGTINTNEHIYEDPEDLIKHFHIPTASKIPSPHDTFGGNEGAAVSSNPQTKPDLSMRKSQQMRCTPAILTSKSNPDFKQAASFEPPASETSAQMGDMVEMQKLEVPPIITTTASNGESESEYKNVIQDSCGDVMTGAINANEHIYKDPEDLIKHFHIPTASKIPSPHDTFGGNEGAAVSSNPQTKSDLSTRKSQQMRCTPAILTSKSNPDFKQAASFEPPASETSAEMREMVEMQKLEVPPIITTTANNGESSPQTESEYNNIIQDSCGDVVTGTINANEHIYEDSEDLIKHFHIPTASNISNPHDMFGGNEAAASSNVQPQTKSDVSTSKSQQMRCTPAILTSKSNPDFKQAASFEPPASETSAEMRDMVEMQKLEVPPIITTTASNGESESEYKNIIQDSCGDVMTGAINANEHIYEDPEDLIKHFHIPTASKIPSPHDTFGGNEGAAVSSNPQTKSDLSTRKSRQMRCTPAILTSKSNPDFKQAVSFEPPASETSAEMVELQKLEEDVPPIITTTASNGESSPQTESEYNNIIQDSCGDVVTGTINANEHIYEDSEDHIKHFHIPTASNISNPHDMFGGNEAAASSNVQPEIKSDVSTSKSQQTRCTPAILTSKSNPYSFEMSAPKPSLPPASEMVEMQKLEEDVPPIITTTASNGESSNPFPQTESEYNIIQDSCGDVVTGTINTNEHIYEDPEDLIKHFHTPTVPPIITTTASSGESSNPSPQTESEYKNIIQAVQFITTQVEEEDEEEEYIEIS